MTTTRLTDLQQRLKEPLPGRSAQYKMAHAVRRTYPIPPSDVRKAAVLALLYQKEGYWYFPLIQRVSTNKNDRHSGQISFPGGMHEQADKSMLFTATRETEEEIGIQADTIEVLGPLTDLYIPVSNFLVYPFVGVIDYVPSFIPQESEVQKVIEVPIEQLIDPATIQKTNIRMSENIILKEVPFYNIQGHVVWGATAMMLAELGELIVPK